MPPKLTKWKRGREVPDGSERYRGVAPFSFPVIIHFGRIIGMDDLILKVAREHTASGAVSAEEFVKLVNQHFTADRHLVAKVGGLGAFDAIFFNFYNLPKDVVAGGAEAQNNRMMFEVSGFDRKDKQAPAPGKVKVEMSVSALPREHKLRAKSGTPEIIAKYLADFINKVAKEVPPNFTHTKR
jgi:hypothetical protein